MGHPKVDVPIKATLGAFAFAEALVLSIVIAFGEFDFAWALGSLIGFAMAIGVLLLAQRMGQALRRLLSANEVVESEPVSSRSRAAESAEDRGSDQGREVTLYNLRLLAVVTLLNAIVVGASAGLVAGDVVLGAIGGGALGFLGTTVMLIMWLAWRKKLQEAGFRW